jgi:hypothetical protein
MAVIAGRPYFGHAVPVVFRIVELGPIYIVQVGKSVENVPPCLTIFKVISIQNSESREAQLAGFPLHTSSKASDCSLFTLSNARRINFQRPALIATF